MMHGNIKINIQLQKLIWNLFENWLTNPITYQAGKQTSKPANKLTECEGCLKINTSMKVYYADNITLKQYLSHFFFLIVFSSKFTWDSKFYTRIEPQSELLIFMFCIIEWKTTDSKLNSSQHFLNLLVIYLWMPFWFVSLTFRHRASSI